MARANSTGMIDLSIREISKMTKEMEKVYISRNKEVLKENGGMMKLMGLDTLFLESTALAVNGKKTNMKGQANTFDNNFLI